MRVRLCGTRGSIASAGPENVRYGGDTSALEIRTVNDRVVVLDAGSGIRKLGMELDAYERVDILLSHLHMDHVQGIPFFRPLLKPDVEAHIWGPISTTRTLRDRLSRYLSPPLFPVRVRDLPNVTFHDVPPSQFEIDTLTITADLVTHPGETLGYRIEENGATVTYLPDHEPALGNRHFPGDPEWTSGFVLAEGADVLIHDAQYSDEEYMRRQGWGHTSYTQLTQFVAMTRPKSLVTFHHDPAHSDDDLDEAHEFLAPRLGDTELIPGTTGLVINL